MFESALRTLTRAADADLARPWTWPGKGAADIRNAYFFILMEEQSALVEDVLAQLAKEGRMLAYRHRGFWQPADTVKERTAMEAACRSGNRPWMRWEQRPA